MAITEEFLTDAFAMYFKRLKISVFYILVMCIHSFIFKHFCFNWANCTQAVGIETSIEINGYRCFAASLKLLLLSLIWQYKPSSFM